MIEIISGSIYKKIWHKVSQSIDLSKLPLYGEFEFSKITAESYGKVKIGMDIERDSEQISLIKSYSENEDALKLNYFTYKWEADEKKLPKDFERYIKPEVVKFIELLSIFKKDNETILRFSILDGDYKDTERPGHKYAVQYALIELFKQI